jgi:type II secretory pathway component PulL
VLSLFAVVLVVWLSSTARSENCNQIAKAMSTNNKALVEAFIPEDKRTPELEAQVAASLAEADKSIKPFLSQCK